MNTILWSDVMGKVTWLGLSKTAQGIAQYKGDPSWKGMAPVTEDGIPVPYSDNTRIPQSYGSPVTVGGAKREYGWGKDRENFIREFGYDPVKTNVGNTVKAVGLVASLPLMLKGAPLWAPAAISGLSTAAGDTISSGSAMNGVKNGIIDGGAFYLGGKLFGAGNAISKVSPALGKAFNFALPSALVLTPPAVRLAMEKKRLNRYKKDIERSANIAAEKMTYGVPYSESAMLGLAETALGDGRYRMLKKDVRKAALEGLMDWRGRMFPDVEDTYEKNRSASRSGLSWPNLLDAYNDRGA